MRGDGAAMDYLDFSTKHKVAVLLPFNHEDSESEDSISLTVSPFYSILTINDVEYYFTRDTGEFDGTAVKVRPDGPVLVYDAG
jgi:hypothetical protein